MYTTGPVHAEDIKWGAISTQEIKIRGGRSTELTPGRRRQDGGRNEWNGDRNGTGRGQRADRVERWRGKRLEERQVQEGAVEVQQRAQTTDNGGENLQRSWGRIALRWR